MFVVINIGCIECGVSSNIVSSHYTEAEAEAVANALLADKAFSWRQGGQNNYVVFEVPAVGKPTDEYAEVAACA